MLRSRAVDALTTAPDAASDRTRCTRVLAVLPSEGLGGGIERYSKAVLGALTKRGIKIVSVALDVGKGTGITRKARFLFDLMSVSSRIRGGEPVMVLIFHPSLAVPTIAALRVGRLNQEDTAVVFYGQDAWGLSAAECWFMRRSRLRLITLSSFSAGAVATLGRTRILPPGFEQVWYDQLVMTARSKHRQQDAWHLLSVFRFDDTETKGAYVLLQACDRLVREGLPITLRIAGTGIPPSRLAAEIANRSDWAKLVVSPADDQLARLYGWADLFVLATRTSTATPLSGEGFGIVLAEAQLAAVPVVAPASGGASSAYLEGLTGVAPVDESVDSLAAVLQHLLSDSATVGRMSANAEAWARERFDPADYTDRVVSVLFDERVVQCLTHNIRPSYRP
jgi:phosphatidyl-myo-inositol dimannoside synthase